MIFTDDILTELREKVKARMSEKRFFHTLGVERCAKRLGELLLPNKVSKIRAAALLHDISKEIPIDVQLQILKDNSFSLTEEDKNTVGVIHSYTAPYVIMADFPEFADEEVLSAVFNHTLGCEKMSIFDKIIFVSDYTEDTRKYDSCIRVRNLLFEGFDKLDIEGGLVRLDEAFLAALNGVLDALKRMNQPINSKIYITKKYLEAQKLQKIK